MGALVNVGAGTASTTVSTSNSAGSNGVGWDGLVIGSGATFAYDNTHTIHGGSIKVATTTSGTSFAYWGNMVGANGQGTECFRVYLYLTALPASSAYTVVQMLTTGGSTAASIRIDSSGNLVLADSVTNKLFGSAVIPTGQWIRLEGYVIGDPAAGQIQVQLFDSADSVTPTETDTTAATCNTVGLIGQVRFGLAAPNIANAGPLWISFPAAQAGQGPIGPVAVVQQMVCGAPVDNGFTVVSKPVGGTALRLKVATDQALTQNVIWMGPQAPDSYGYVRHVVTGLQPHTQYYCQLADSPSGGAEVLVGMVGACKTLPAAGLPADFTVSLVSCIDSGGNTDSPTAAIDDWVTWNADLKIFTGDFNYDNPVFTDVADQVTTIEQQICEQGDANTGSMQNLTSKAWGYYCRSDHDTGPDNGDSDTNYMPYNLTAMQEVFPYGTLGDTESPVHGLYQSWVAGRVRFIMVDIRNIDRSPGASTDDGGKTMLGSTQLEWFFNQLIMPEPLKVVIGDTAWMGNFLNTDLDKWWSYDTERQAIIDFIAANAAAVQNLMWWHGDTHGLGTATAAENTWGGWPVYCAAPMKQTGAAVPNSSTFGQFYNNAGGDCRQYGRITLTDSGTAITSVFSGWDALAGVQRITQTDVFPTITPVTPVATTSPVFFANPSGNELAVLTNTFKVSGSAADPTTVSLVVTDPTGAQTTYAYNPGTITRASAGVYTLNVECLIDGLWSYVWIGTGAAADVVAGTWTVAPATVGRWYTSVEELKSRVGITDTVDDFECVLAVQAAAAWIEQFCGRFFWNESGVRTYRNTSIYEVEIDDLVSITQFATDIDGDGVYETVWTSSQYQLEVTDHIYNPAAKGEPWPYTKIQALGVPGGNYLPYVWAWSHQDRVQVTGTFGWATVPTLVRQASLQLASDYLKLKDAPFGVAGFSEYGAVRVRDNPQIASMLRRYVRPRVKVGV